MIFKITFAASIALFSFASVAMAVDTVRTPIMDYVPYSVAPGMIAYARNFGSRMEAGSDSTLRLYDMTSNALLKTIKIPRRIDHVKTQSYEDGPNGFVVVDGYSAGYTSIYKVKIDSGKITPIFPVPSGTHLSSTKLAPLFFSDDYSKIISKSETDSSYFLTYPLIDSTKRVFIAPKKYIEFAAFSPDAQRIITLNSKDTSAQLWNGTADTLLFSLKFPYPIIPTAVFFNGGKKVLVPMYRDLSGKKDGFAIVDAVSGTLISTDSTDAGGMSWWLYCVLVFNANDSLLAISNGSKVSVLDFTRHTLLEQFTGPVPNDNWSIAKATFATGDTSVLVPAFHSGTMQHRCYEIAIQSRSVRIKFSRQDRPAVGYAGFNDKGEPLFVGNYHYSTMDPYSGLSEFNTMVFWNQETGMEFAKRQTISQPVRGSNRVVPTFSPDGKRMFKESWTIDVGSDLYGIDVVNTTDTGKPVLSFPHSYRHTELVSQDKRSVCIFDSASVAIIDALKNDTLRFPFTLPSNWTACGVVPSQNIAFACSTNQASSTSNAVYWLNVWNLKTNAKINPLAITSSEDNIIPSSFPRILLTPDGTEVIVASGSGVKKIEINTGKENRWFSSKSAPTSVLFSPDGAHLLIGDSCYSTSTWELERVYRDMTGYNRIVFNPVNNKQFIAGTKIWELPNANAIFRSRVAPIDKRVTIRYLNSGRFMIDLPSAQGTKALIAVYQPNGRRIEESQTVVNSACQAIKIPKLARGVYLYKFEVPSISVKNRGIFIVQ